MAGLYARDRVWRLRLPLRIMIKTVLSSIKILFITIGQLFVAMAGSYAGDRVCVEYIFFIDVSTIVKV